MRKLMLALAVLALIVGASAWLGFGVAPDICVAQQALDKRGAIYLKSHQRLCVYEAGEVALSAPASHGRVAGAKHCEGDLKTPEGAYTLSSARASQRYGRFLPIAYPNANDRKLAQQLACPAGGAIGVHGPQQWYEWLGSAQSLVNHTDGCIVVDAPTLARLEVLITKDTVLRIAP